MDDEINDRISTTTKNLSPKKTMTPIPKQRNKKEPKTYDAYQSSAELWTKKCYDLELLDGLKPLEEYR